jgi:hypothetical protein
MNETGDGPGVGLKELRGRRGRSATTIHGWPAALFGLPFLAVGVVGVAQFVGQPAQVDAPRPMILWFGVVFGLAGLSLIVHGLRGLVRRRRVADRRERHPAEPWLWDYDWPRHGVTDRAGRAVVRTFMGAAALVVFLLPFNWIGFGGMGDVPGVALWMLVVGLFDLVTLTIIGYALYLLLRYLKYGTSRLAFEGFPFHLGEEMVVRFEGSGGAAGFDRVAAKLLCIEERYEMRGSGKNRSQQVVCYECYADTLTIEDARARLPHEAPPTRLSERPAHFWVVDVEAAVPGVDYRGSFLVPVYRAPDAGSL